MTVFCNTCPFLGTAQHLNDDDDEVTVPVCRRHAPVGSEDGVFTSWPQVMPEIDWCGDHPGLINSRASLVWSKEADRA